MALKEPLYESEMRPAAIKKEIGEAIKGNMIGYDLWISLYERKWGWRGCFGVHSN